MMFYSNVFLLICFPSKSDLHLFMNIKFQCVLTQRLTLSVCYWNSSWWYIHQLSYREKLRILTVVITLETSSPISAKPVINLSPVSFDTSREFPIDVVSISKHPFVTSSFDPSILRHSGIWGMADEVACWTSCIKKIQKSPFKVSYPSKSLE